MSRLIAALLIVLATQGFAQEEWSLQRCIGYALENNIQVKQSEVSVNISEQNYNQSRAAALPTLNGFASHGYNWGQRIDPFTNQFATQRVRNNTFAVNSSITLFGGFTTINNIRKSKFDLLASKYNVDKMRNDIAMNLATTFLQVLFNEELLEISKKQVDASRLQLQRLESLEQQGQIARGQVLDMRAQLANDELNVVNRQNALDLSRLSLIQLMQLKGQEAASFRIARPDLSSIDPTELQNTPGQVFDQAVRTLPEVKSAEASLSSSELALKSARGSRYPQLNLNGSYGSGYSGLRQEITGTSFGEPTLIGFTGTSGESVFVPQPIYTFTTIPFGDQIRDNVNQSLSFTLNIPIFNGWAVNSGIGQAKLAAQSARLSLQSTRDVLQQNVTQAFADASAAYKRFKAAENAVSSRREAFKFAEIRFNENMITNVEYADASNRLYQAESEALQAKYDYLFRVKVIEFYQGKPLTF